MPLSPRRMPDVPLRVFVLCLSSSAWQAEDRLREQQAVVSLVASKYDREMLTIPNPPSELMFNSMTHMQCTPRHAAHGPYKLNCQWA